MINAAKHIKYNQKPLLIIVQKERAHNVAQVERPVLDATHIGDVYDSSYRKGPSMGAVFVVTNEDHTKTEFFVPVDGGDVRFDCASIIESGRKSLQFQEIAPLLKKSPFNFPPENIIKALKTADNNHHNEQFKKLQASFDIKNLSLS